MSNIKEMRDLSMDQLEVFIEDAMRDIYKLRNELAMTKKIEKPHMIREKRRDIARAKFILAEKRKQKGGK